MTREFLVLGAGVWTPGATTLEDFLRLITPVAAAPQARPDAQLLTPRMRGRASPLTAMFANVAEQATRAAGIDPGTLPSLFGSAYGEMATIGVLLAQLTAAGDFSPARFQASVHNTAAGQLSIALGNRSFSSSIAAGHDTLAMLWLEACAYLHEHPGELLLVCGDEGPSSELQPGLVYPPLAAAWVVSNRAHARAVAHIGWPSPSNSSRPPASARDNPCAPALALVRSMFSGERGTFALNGEFQLEVQSLSR